MDYPERVTEDNKSIRVLTLTELNHIIFLI